MPKNAERMFPNVINVRGRLFNFFHRAKFRQQVWKDAEHLQRAHGRVGFGSLENLEQLVALTFGRDIWQESRGSFHCLARFEFDLEIECRGLTHAAQDADGIVRKRSGRAGADGFGAQVRGAVERINQGLVVDVERNGVDREIAGAQIGFQ